MKLKHSKGTRVTENDLQLVKALMAQGKTTGQVAKIIERAEATVLALSRSDSLEQYQELVAQKAIKSELPKPKLEAKIVPDYTVSSFTSQEISLDRIATALEKLVNVAEKKKGWRL